MSKNGKNALARLRQDIARLAPSKKSRQLPTMEEQAFRCQFRIEQDGFRWDAGRGLWRHKDGDNRGFKRYAKEKTKC